MCVGLLISFVNVCSCALVFFPKKIKKKFSFDIFLL